MSEIMIHKLCEDISDYDGFVLYGAGFLARKMLEELKKNGILSFVLCCNKFRKQ